jgi:amino acid transporter
MERTLKAVGIAAGLVALLVLVAMAARGTHPGTSGHVATRPVPNTVQDGFITLLAVVYVVVIGAIVVAFFRYKDRWSDPGSHWLKNFVLVLILMGIATAVGYYAIQHGHLREQAAKARRAQAQSGNTQNRIGHVPATPARQAHFEWPLVLGIGGLVLLGGVWMYVRSRRRLAPLFEERGLEEDMVSAIETTIDDLRGERDARRAVIAAYASMERTLARHGFARHRSEAPLEYLANILRGLHVRESAVVTLTRLFEFAKFSGHEVDAAMKEEAIEALIAIRDDLQREEARAA